MGANANVIENIVKTTDQSTPTLKAVKKGVDDVSDAIRKVPKQPIVPPPNPNIVPNLKLIKSELQGVTGALTTLAPQASAALAPMQAFASLGSASLGPVAIAAAGIAVSLGTLAALAKKAADEVAALGAQAEKIQNLSQSTGVSAAAIQGLQANLAASGVDAGTLVTGFRTLNKAISEQDATLVKLGITTTDTFEAFKQLADLFARTADGPNKTALAVALLGRSGQELIPILNQGSDALVEMIDRAQKLGIAFSDDTVKKLVAVDNQFDSLKQKTEGLKNSLVLLAVPAVSGLIGQLNDLLDTLNKMPKALDDFGTFMDGALKKGVPGFEKISKVVAVLNTFTHAMEVAEKAQKATVATGFTSPAHIAQVEKENAPPPAPTVAKPLTGEALEREKMLKRLQELLKLTRSEAVAAFNDLKKLDDAASANDLAEKLAKARSLQQTGATRPATVEEDPKRIEMLNNLQQLLKLNTEQANEAATAIARLDAAASANDVTDKLNKAIVFQQTGTLTGAVQGPEENPAVKSILNQTELIKATFQDLGSALQSGFASVFLNLGNKMQTLGSAIKTIFKSIAAELAALVAKIAALEILKLLIPGGLFGKLFGLAQGGEVRLAQGGQVTRETRYAAGGVVVPAPRVVVNVSPPTVRYAAGGVVVGAVQRYAAGGLVSNASSLVQHFNQGGAVDTSRHQSFATGGHVSHVQHYAQGGPVSAVRNISNSVRRVVSTVQNFATGGIVHNVRRMFTGGDVSHVTEGDRSSVSQVQNVTREGDTSSTVQRFAKSVANTVQRFATGGITNIVQHFEPGGPVFGPGTETSDSIPARLSVGEFVVRAAVVKRPQVLNFLNVLNSGAKITLPIPGVTRAEPRREFAVGGFVTNTREIQKVSSTLIEKHFGPGGLVFGPGSETSDDIPAKLSRGEFVVRAAVVKRPGVLDFLKSLNTGATTPQRQVFQSGGVGAQIARSSAAPSSFRPDQSLITALARITSAVQAQPVNVSLYSDSAPNGATRARGEAASQPTGSGRPLAGDTYIINAINARDAIMSLTQPQGELRKAMDSVAIAGAY